MCLPSARRSYQNAYKESVFRPPLKYHTMVPSHMILTSAIVVNIVFAANAEPQFKYSITVPLQ